ncbi:hypothetical protein [Luteimonas mephitis]|uniref:hypothetical protein n=1 Tax=Luteimonas mephitis TaxID=83615 RepID=UPI003A8F30D0
MPKHRPVVCLHCQVEHPEAHHERVVYNKTPLYGPWVDWRMAGKDLTSSEADRISVRRFSGIPWAERSRKRILRILPRQTLATVTLPARESFTDIA